MRFTLRQLEVFVAIARGENVSRAAESLSLSQSATSAALAELENQFDRPLFDRVGKRLRLNEHGRLLLPKTVELLDRALELEGLLQADDTPGSLKVGATLTIGNYLAPLIASDYLQRHPSGQVSLSVHNTATIVARVSRYEIDLGLIEGRTDEPDVEVEPWVRDELVPFCAPSHPLAGRKELRVEELMEEWWILREHGSGTRETLEGALRHHGGLRVRLELEHTEAIKRAVENGLGIGCISRLALRDAFRRGSLVPLETPGLDLSRRFQFVWHRGKYHTAAMRAFLAACRRMTEGAGNSHEIPLPPVK
ncbi:LysR family transcriptional regulator [Pseudothauera nasutitermitis]|uniref:LysR family transcriptional regulator n=1 Tax=Pseudothauera nasutitermitis TaxID=2565930 RepID=A0A4S4B198_9RHOO|nr:LysR family transcriptional regulator [Pseudothauera nasutitermitis]THF66283.1 LysR family transcriptional regulator [Pseudothauera nasutitermitis]